MQDLTENKIVDRIAIVLSQETGVQLLGIPKIENGTGEVMAEAVFTALSNWNATNDIVAMSFDTTSSNSGQWNGAAVLLERKLNKNLLKLACRHHIYEVVLRAVFEEKLGKTTGPVVTMFKNFREQWSKIDQTKFKPGIDDVIIKDRLDVAKSDIVTFCKEELKRGCARDDYKELLELTLIFLGEYNVEVRFRLPGSISHARWMAKAIYSLKIFMFASEFQLTKKEKDSLRDICSFIVKFYVKIWFQSTKPIQAPRLDLSFIKDLKAYASVDPDSSSAALIKFRTQSWYLSEELVTLSLFDTCVTDDEKRQIVERLNAQSEPNEESQMFRLIIPQLRMESISEWSLNDFITENSINMFTRYGISTEFLNLDPSEWHTNEKYKTAQEILSKIQVTNDHAERGIGLLKRFNKLLVKDEEQAQYIYQVVSKHEREDKGITKSALKREEIPK